MTDFLEQEKLHIPIHPTFDLQDCAKAHEVVETGHRTGAVVLIIN